ncbi:hypothetical protein DFR76_106434 [Nocardia pseudobrasiliensis]|uniref:Uncharacterized protein n=1 Tax=Nocardia pseudobrasiliensis TaxID=45979 RepID=A0A370I496_9NOCA|nr:hypothetical protein DFR76_106434 [Nocardia pseudobrasiliensis]
MRATGLAAALEALADPVRLRLLSVSPHPYHARYDSTQGHNGT